MSIDAYKREALGLWLIFTICGFYKANITDEGAISDINDTGPSTLIREVPIERTWQESLRKSFLECLGYFEGM